MLGISLIVRGFTYKLISYIFVVDHAKHGPSQGLLYLLFYQATKQSGHSGVGIEMR